MAMSRLRALSIAFTLAFALAGAARGASTTARSAPDTRTRTLLGVVNEAGLLTPIIQFDGDRWRSSWPEPDTKLADVPLPSSLEQVPSSWTGSPIPARWYAWPREGAASGGSEIRVTRPVRYDAHCVPGFGLQADARTLSRLLSDSKPPTASHAFPKRKVAVALSNADARVERIVGVDADVSGGGGAHAVATRDLLRAAESFFRASVKEAASRESRTLASGRATQVKWTGVWSYALPGSDERIYLLEGHAREIDTITGSLWLRTRAGAVVEHRGHALFDDADFKRTPRRRPMAVIAIGARRFWLSQIDRYESESYELLDLTSVGLSAALTIPGGGC